MAERFIVHNIERTARELEAAQVGLITDVREGIPRVSNIIKREIINVLQRPKHRGVSGDLSRWQNWIVRKENDNSYSVSSPLERAARHEEGGHVGESIDPYWFRRWALEKAGIKAWGAAMKKVEKEGTSPHPYLDECIENSEILIESKLQETLNTWESKNK